MTHMTRRWLTSTAAILLVFSSGCRDNATGPAPSAPDAAAVIVPAGPDQRVHFLPPLAPQAARTGNFDGTLAPVVEVCAWHGVWTESACALPVVSYTTLGSGAERVRVAGDHYVVNWNTGQPGLDPTANHRIRVLLGAEVQGHVDVTFARGAAAGTLVPVNLRSTVPVRFWIGAAAEGERFVAAAGGGTFELYGGTVKLVIPAGALAGETNISVHRLREADLPADPVPAPGTMFRFEPAGLQFNLPVSLTLAFDPALLPAGVTGENIALYHMPVPASTPAPLAITVRTASSVTAEINGFSYYFGGYIPIIPDYQVSWLGGAAGGPSNWSIPANWNPARVPGTADYAFIDAATYSPELTSPQTVGGLVVGVGGSLNLQSHQITVSGNVSARGLITGDGVVKMAGASPTTLLRGNLPELWVSQGSVKLSGPTDIARRVLLSGHASAPAASLSIDTFTMNVGGEFRTEGGTGQLVMDKGKAVLNITGPLRFRAGGSSSLLSNGIMTLVGGFEQAVSAAAVQGSPAHRLVLAGDGNGHVMTMEHAGQSYLGEVELASSGGITMLGDVAINGNFSYADAAIGALIYGPGRTLTVRDVALLRGSATLAALRVGGGVGQVTAYAYNVTTTTFTGLSPFFPEQILGDIKFKNVIVDGGSLRVGAPFVQINGNLTINSGRVGFTAGSERTLIVAGDLTIEGLNSHLSMTQAADRMVVHGNATFRGRTLANGLSAGRLWLGGNVTQGNGDAAFRGSASHTTILFGSGTQLVTFAQAQNQNWFGRLAITNAGGGAKFTTNAEARYRVDLVGRTLLDADRVLVVDTVIYRSTSYSKGANFAAKVSCKWAYAEAGAVIDNFGDPIVGVGGCQVGPGSVPAQGSYAVPSSITVQITAPASEAVYTTGQSVTFTGSATDTDSSPLSGSALTWQSSIDGTLGSGASVTTTTLSTGVHLIRLVATGADGTSAMASILVKVEAAAVDPANLAIALTARPGAVTVGGEMTHTITVTNAGPGTVNYVNITVDLNAAVKFVSSSYSECNALTSPSASSRRWSCTLPDELPSGGLSRLTLRVAVAAAGTLTSTASIVSWTGGADPDLVNNNAIVTTAVSLGGVGTLSGKLLFATDRDAQPFYSDRRIYTRDLSTGTVTRLMSGSQPVWSKAGRIAFVLNDEIWTMNADGSNADQLTETDGKASAPAWSPDGTQIAFMRGGTSFDLSVVTVATGAIRVLTQSTANDRYPEWTADGQRIMFARDHASIRSVRAADGGDEMTILTFSQPHNPAYSPDGTKIAFSTPGGGTGAWTIRVLTVATGVVTTILSNDAVNRNPAWSPDGGWITFTRSPTGLSTLAGTEIWAMLADGTGGFLVEASGYGDFSPTWR
jgi:uncharacterized repeat protein (TIGR01451 family)